MTKAERMKKYRQDHPGRAYETNKAWRVTHPETRYIGKKRYYDKTSFAPNGYNKWSLEEIDLVLAHEIPDSKLSEKIGRSVAAIQHIRYKYKEDIKDESTNNEQADNL